MNISRKVTVRESTFKDFGFIYTRWLESYKTSPFARKIKNSIYWVAHKNLIKLMEANPDFTVHIACLKTDPDVILGFLATSKVEDTQVAHYVYVKQDFRKMGVASLMLAKSGLDTKQTTFYTHLTKHSHWICQKLPKLEYNPYAL